MLAPVTPAVLCGRLMPLGPKHVPSGIAKMRAPAPWRITRTGLAGDAQGDTKNHGGLEKAVHQYPFDHYAEWQREFGEHPLLGEPGAFGENLSTTGWTEETVHIGDVVRFGSAVMQISQGRQPCWKLNARFERQDVAFRTQMSGRTGWYYRVLEEGTADPSDRLELVQRLRPGWPLARLIALLYRDKERYDELAEMAAIPELAEGWRKLAARRIETRTTESWTARLTGQN